MVIIPRHARNKGEFCIYHVILRGNEKKNIFFTEEEKQRFKETLSKMMVKYNFKTHAFCIMDNHVHLIINDNGNDISKIMKSINISYAYFYNRIHRRCGHLFQDRFRSEIIKDEVYFLQVSKYIHNNPVKAGIVKSAGEYKWSSYNLYTGREKDRYNLVETEKLLGIISSIRSKAVSEYIRYVSEDEETAKIMDVEEYGINDEETNALLINTIEEARIRMAKTAKDMGYTNEDIYNNISLRNILIKEIRKNSLLTLKQIGELFRGLSESRVSRILKN